MPDGGHLRILIVDDHALLREGLRRLLDEQPDFTVVGEAHDGEQALDAAAELCPHVALIDISMPTIDGMQLTRRITARCPDVRVVALTRHDDASFVLRMLEAGAAGYVLKQSASIELTRAIRAVAAGDRYIDSAIRHRPRISFAPHGITAPPPPHVALTEEEEKVLRLIASAHSNQEIANILACEVSHVLYVRATAMASAGLPNRVAIVRYAQARGWVDAR